MVSPHSGSLSVLGWATGNTDSLDSPQPGLGGSHHLPPYSILYITPPHLHPNGTFSRDSQSGVPKLSRFGLPGLWAFITSRLDLRSGRDLKQICSSPQGLSNSVSHFTCTHRDQVDSRLLVVESQIVSLTPGLSFNHNLCYICPNGSCEAILDIYTSIPFQHYKEHLKARCFDPYNWPLSSRESLRTPKSHFRECEWQPHTSLKVGCDILHLRKKNPMCVLWTLCKYCSLIPTIHIGFMTPIQKLHLRRKPPMCVMWTLCEYCSLIILIHISFVTPM